ncbi:FtsX-like permease family [Janthinobacterium sp. HH01]|uniref:ABC transporter permease n=1 Tax=Janthinobacterium sp. HH01 TaxID=1198452 RepID=UPI0002AED884|nr:ABC transporter permease [Janthinobacterium sp. HH01]ELX10016.1 FtsX-like permease family [Janthinobacterium sp. HH01]
MINLRDFRIGLRLLAKEPGYSAVIMLGLSIGFGVCLLMLGYVRYVSSYDASVPETDRVFLVKYKYNLTPQPQWFELAPLPLMEVALRSGLVESATALNAMKATAKVGPLAEAVELAAVHPGFGQMFGVAALEGDLRKALTQPDMVALTRGMALKLFGREHVLGRTLQVAGKTLTVAAVLADPPSNSTVSYTGLVGIETTLWPAEERKMLFQSWSFIYAKIYVKLKPNASAAVLGRIMQDAAANSPLVHEMSAEDQARMGGQAVAEIRLGPLPGMYFDSDTAGSPDSGEHGDIRAAYGLAGIALLILLLATVNYVNLATVRTLQRRREIAVRKVLGAGVGRVAAQFLAESLLVALLATALGLLIAYLLQPLFAALVDRKVDQLFTLPMLMWSLALGVLVGLVSALYPLWVALRVRPPEAMASRGAGETVGASSMRRLLTVLQFATAIGLTGVTLTIAYQTWFAMQSDPGFSADPLLVVNLPANLSTPEAAGFRAALAQTPGVDGVAGAQSPLGVGFTGRFYAVTRDDGTSASIVARPVTPNFFDVYGIAPLAGRLFDSRRDQANGQDNIVISAAALRPLHFASPEAAIGKSVRLGAHIATIVGVAPDIKLEGLHKSTRAVIYATSMEVGVLTARTGGDVAALAETANGLLRQYFPNDVIDVRRAYGHYARGYAEDVRLVKLLGAGSVLAIGIAAFGIYVLAACTVQRRAREIVIRKLHGANARAIGLLIAREFALLTAAGAAAGLPVAWYASRVYLATFVELAPLGMLPLAAALLVIFAVALGATLTQTVKASRLVPAVALRTL